MSKSDDTLDAAVARRQAEQRDRAHGRELVEQVIQVGIHKYGERKDHGVIEMMVDLGTLVLLPHTTDYVVVP